MELGKIQKAWIGDLRKYPERQGSSYLAKKYENEITQACCLGQALLTYCELENKEPTWEYEKSNDSYVLSDLLQSQCSLAISYHKLGLRGPLGELLKPKKMIEEEFREDDNNYYSLASMNDNDIPWSKIADYIESNPENVFQESI